jgi:hypothetical protein
LIWPGNVLGFEGDLAACAPWSQQLLRNHFRASYKPVMSMTRPTKHIFFVDITRVYTMTGLAERGAAADRTTQTIEVGGSAHRVSTVEDAGLTVWLVFGLLEWSADLIDNQGFELRQAVQAA